MYAIGPPHVVISAVREFERGLEERCGLRLQWHKTEWFSWEGATPAGTPQEMQLAGECFIGDLCAMASPLVRIAMST